MSTYLLLKWVHILSSVLLVGTGFGSAFYLFFIHRTRDVRAIAEVSRLVVKADYWFTAPTVILQPLSGFAMLYIVGYSWTQPWLLWTYALYTLAGICWLPVVWLQVQMARLAQNAASTNGSLPDQYWRFARYWELLGYPAFIAMVAIYALMVFKPI